MGFLKLKKLARFYAGRLSNRNYTETRVNDDYLMEIFTGASGKMASYRAMLNLKPQLILIYQFIILGNSLTTYKMDRVNRHGTIVTMKYLKNSEKRRNTLENG